MRLPRVTGSSLCRGLTEINSNYCEAQVTVYDAKPVRFLEQIQFVKQSNLSTSIQCAGFELEHWRCAPFAEHLIEWLPEYALPEEELQVHHGNMYVKLKQAALRVYTSDKYKSRGEAGEIAIHAICRDFFGTIPISPRVFYKSASNDVIKSFDMVHARFPDAENVELWMGESKLYGDAASAIKDAIASVEAHLEQGFLKNQKLLLGPQIPKATPNYSKIQAILQHQSSLDELIAKSIFVVGILCNSSSAKSAKSSTKEYKSAVALELNKLSAKITASGLSNKIKIILIYVPLADKEKLVTEFDAKLKGLQ